MVLFLRNKRYNVNFFIFVTNSGGGDYHLRSAQCRKTHLGGCDYQLRISAQPPPSSDACFENLNDLKSVTQKILIFKKLEQTIKC